MSASHVRRTVGVLLGTARAHAPEGVTFLPAFITSAAGYGRRAHRNRPMRVGYSDAEPARAGEGERHE